MPEFILDYGTQESARAFRALDSFTQGYIEAMFFTDCEHGTVRIDPDSDEPRNPHASHTVLWQPELHSSLPGDVSIADLAPETLAKIITDCERFQTANAALLEQAAELEPGSESFRCAKDALDGTRLGQLLWYARNGHGIGFDDDGNAPCLKALQAACGHGTDFRQVDSYIGDDGKVYLM